MKSDNKPRTGRAAAGGGRAVRDLFILIAMTVVAFAVGLGLLVQFGQGLAMSAGVALLAYIAMLGAHSVVRSGEREADLRGQLANQAAEIARLRLQMSETAVVEAPRKALEPRVQELHSEHAALHAPVRDLSGFEGPLVAELPPLELQPQAIGAPPPAPRDLNGEAVVAELATVSAMAPESVPIAPSGPPAGSGSEAVAQALEARVADDEARPLPRADELPPAAQSAPAVDVAAAPAPVRGPPKSDVEMIEGLIRKLADDLSTPPLPPAGGVEHEAPGAIPPPPAEPVEAALARSIAALQQAAGGMRQIEGLASVAPPAPPRGEVVAAAHAFAAQVAAATPPPPAVPQRAQLSEAPQGAPLAEPPPLDLPERPGADVIAEAVERDRIELFLEPILSLFDRKSRHFEVSVRLRTADGAIVDAVEARQAAAGTGVLPRLDAAKLARTARIIRRLEERGKLSSVFSNLSGESLGDELFLGDFVDLVSARRSVTGYLVLGFTQGDVRSFSDAHWDTLAKLNRLGFRFALEEVGDLDMDLEEMKLRGFAYVRLDASVLLAGMPAADGLVVSAADVARHLVETGLTVIAGRIAAENELQRITDLGIALGQGPLFGGPHPVKAEILSQPIAAGAPAAA